jgi:hypothetical protein
MKALFFFKMFGTSHPMTQCNIPGLLLLHEASLLRCDAVLNIIKDHNPGLLDPEEEGTIYSMEQSPS